MSDALLKCCLRNKGVRISLDGLVFVLKTLIRINENRRGKDKRYNVPLFYSQSTTVPIAERKALFLSAQITVGFECLCLSPAPLGSFLSEESKEHPLLPPPNKRKKTAKEGKDTFFIHTQ